MMKNLAGNEVSIFLYRFVLLKNGINFVLNESIAEDMYPDIEAQIEPLVHACSETLMRYKHLCHGDTIMDGNILVDGYFEVMLSQGLGKHFVEREKQNLFNDANEIANLLLEIMDRRTKEIKQDTYPGPQPVIRKIQRTGVTNAGLEALGQKQQQSKKLPWYASDKPGLKQLKPDDLPDGVVAKRGYDHRGYCIAFEHKTLGELGKIILIDVEDDKMLLEAELSKENRETLDKRQKVLEQVISIIEVTLSNTPVQENT